MIILFHSSPEIKRVLDDLLETGNYRDYSEIISLAVMNLEVLHNETEEVGILLNGITGIRNKIAISNEAIRSEDHPIKPEIHKGKSTYSSKLPQLLEQLHNKIPPVVFPKVEKADPIKAKLPLDQWIFGQHNRLLPVKVSCRAIGNLMMTEGSGVQLKHFASRIADSAASLAVELRRVDKKHGLKRDEALATAFPAPGKRRHKSVDRFISQFIAQTTRQGRLTGLPADLKLITKVEGLDDLITLTEAGWEFAALSNPILDDDRSLPTEKLSQEERDYLLNHILRSVPVESAAFLEILEFIHAGSDTPVSIDKALKNTLSKEKIEKFSDSFLSSQRSGAISRMVDLHLVVRVRDGIRVRYSATKSSEVVIKHLRSQ